LLKNVAVKYAGPWHDYSGYGEANRNFIAALHSAGVKVTTEAMRFVPEEVDTGWMGALARDLEGRLIDYRVKILHMTPDFYDDYLEEGVYNIGHLFWETDRVPREWIDHINKLDEVWTASKEHALLFMESGVKVPIQSFPQCFDPRMYEGVKPFRIPQARGYVFYSIFQWTERKNPKALLEAYWRTFEGVEDVTLLLKTYRSSFAESEFRIIIDEINQWKKELGLKHYPRVLLCDRLMSREEIIRLHASCDCFVSAHRGEGWGLPQMEAMAVGNPVISTNYGGIHHYLHSQAAHLLPYKLVPVFGMSWIPWYKGKQKWAEVDMGALCKALRKVYERREVAARLGERGRRLVQRLFDYRVVGPQLRDRLETIYYTLWSGQGWLSH